MAHRITHSGGFGCACDHRWGVLAVTRRARLRRACDHRWGVLAVTRRARLRRACDHR
jgi:hypothetical protein